MTDYELFAALNMTINLLWTIFSIYVSIVFAFLIAAYLVADKLKSKIVALVIALYSLVVLWCVTGITRTGASLSTVIEEMKRAVLESESSLGWYNAVNMPDAATAVTMALVSTIAILAYIGSIIFFFHQRKEV